MAIMNPSKLRDCYDALPHSNLSETKQKALEALITKYLNGELVPVVRCRECRWFKPYQKPVEDFDGRCVVHMCETDEEEYCSIGKRRNNETD